MMLGRCRNRVYAGDPLLCLPPRGQYMLLLVGMVAWFVRYAFFALGVSKRGRFLPLSGILLHGVCYDFFLLSALSIPTAWRGEGQRPGKA